MNSVQYLCFSQKYLESIYAKCSFALYKLIHNIITVAYYSFSYANLDASR